MIKTVKIDKFNFNEFEGKYGKSYKIGIQSNGVWINGFANSVPSWSPGDEVELEVWNDEKWGWKFKLPQGSTGSSTPAPSVSSCNCAQELQALKTEIMLIRTKLGLQVNSEPPTPGPVMPSDPNYVDVDSIPF